MQETKEFTRLNPLNDYAFLISMGKKGDETQLLSFLSATLRRTGKANIKAVEILGDTDITAELLGAKSAKLDVLAKLEDGTKVNIEVQIRNQHNMEKRSLFYWAKKFTEDLQKGRDYAELPPVITINIVDYEQFKPYKGDSEQDKEDVQAKEDAGVKDLVGFHSSFHIREDEATDLLLTDALEMHFLDMVKFRKLRRKKSAGFDIHDPLHRWMAYLDPESPEGLVKEAIDMDKDIKAFQNKMDEIQRDPEMSRLYEWRMKALMDWNTNMKGEREVGRKEGNKERTQMQNFLKNGGTIEEYFEQYPL
jgi:hypothetical protein